MGKVDPSKILREIRKLVLASDTMIQCRSLLSYMKDNDFEFNHPLYSAMICGALTAYARNFNSADNIGKLNGSYEKFEEDAVKAFHDLVLKLRNKVHAHRDLSFEHEGKEYEHKIEVRINDGEIEFKPITPDLYPDQIDTFIGLIDTQIERIYKDINSKLGTLDIVNTDTGGKWHELKIT